MFYELVRGLRHLCAGHDRVAHEVSVCHRHAIGIFGGCTGTRSSLAPFSKMLRMEFRTHQLYVSMPMDDKVFHTVESTQVVATEQSRDVEGQQPATHVPLAVVNKHESVTAQAYGYASSLVST